MLKMLFRQAATKTKLKIINYKIVPNIRVVHLQNGQEYEKVNKYVKLILFQTDIFRDIEKS